MSTALYRRYRPDTFAEVIGQEHVTAPLMTALGKDAVSHAYLFSGPRGCGKTTSARILARCLNCAQGPTGTPCGVCDSCVDLATGGSGSLDVIEIDAASHGGVDDARDLRERATFAPVRDRYKIFIIDEAHMVTAAGFNALLKIVEEPPEHIKFIFATTEPDKVIGTIRSRTHHYPFRLVPPEPLMDYLHRLCEQESVSVAPGVLPLVIRAGGGSVRDTLSVLDQLIAGSTDSGLDYDRATALLGFTHATLLDDVVDSVASLDGATAFAVVDRVVQSGQDPRRFVEDLLERLRDLIIVKSVPENPGAILRGVPEDQIRVMQTQAGKLGSAELSRAADITAQALTDMVGATSPKLHLELLMARLLLPHAEQGHSSVAARLERVERRLDFSAGAGVTPEPEPQPASSTPTQAAPHAQSSQQAQPGAESARQPQATSAPAPQSGTGPDRGPQPDRRAPGDPEPQPDREPQRPPKSEGEQPWEPATPAAEPTAAEQPDPAQEEPSLSQPTPAAESSAAAAAPRTGEPSPATPVTPQPAAQSESSTGVSPAEMMRRAWPDIVDSLKSQSRMLWMLVKGNVEVGDFDGQTLTLNFANEGAKSTFANRHGEQALNSAVQDVLGMQVRLTLNSGGSSSPGGGGGPKADRRLSPADAGDAQTVGGSPSSADDPADDPADGSPAWVQEEPPEPYDPGFYEAPPEPPAEAPSPRPAEPEQLEPEQLERDRDELDRDPNPAAASASSSDIPPSEPESYKPLETKPPVPAFARRASAGPRSGSSPVSTTSQSESPTAAPAAAPASGGAPSRAAEIRRRLAQRRGEAAPAPTEPPTDHDHPAPPPDPAWDSGPPSDYDQAAPPSWAQPPGAPGTGAPKGTEPEDIASEDDVALEHSGVFGRKAFEKHLGATLLEERWLNEQAR
ncbi:DNA polymerase III subunit gamma and tau [Nesterenkonia halotolerans]|uniref:DNA-directed DNA polymerase n=1 Tax=Nesterenkonia halotolerans TaxID=225325 RepID=A0ABR9J6D4_9MICC|nr:DNA polymerase III subunit gamma and tau [Nesterenkonia halotolerans]MBE1514548.1 DNA polymerase-3 subunit gamma/tau [Nesterenkonia halotolerans]